MIHPSTQLKIVNPEIGYGVFATEFIPKGTIVYVKDQLEIVIEPDDPILKNKQYSKTINHFSYIDESGNRIVSWDIAKYVNHCCNFNTISTGYGFEIAVRDIQLGEEITDEYGLFNVENEMELKCKFKGCRKKLRFTDIDQYYSVWDSQIKDALSVLNKVKQPLYEYIDLSTKTQLINYLKTGKGYQSVLCLKYSKPKYKKILKRG